MNKLRGVTLPKKWLTFDEIKDKVAYPTAQNKIEQLEKYIEVKEQECDDLQDIIDKAIEDLEKTKELNDKHILARDNVIIHLDIDHIEYLLNILKGDNK